MGVRITCIAKDNGFHLNPYIAIARLGWTNDADQATGISTRLQIYEYLQKGGVAYVLDSLGNKAYLITAETAEGARYVKTVPDKIITDNLLTLPECP